MESSDQTALTTPLSKEDITQQINFFGKVLQGLITLQDRINTNPALPGDSTQQQWHRHLQIPAFTVQMPTYQPACLNGCSCGDASSTAIEKIKKTGKMVEKVNKEVVAEDKTAAAIAREFKAIKDQALRQKTQAMKQRSNLEEEEEQAGQQSDVEMKNEEDDGGQSRRPGLRNRSKPKTIVATKTAKKSAPVRKGRRRTIIQSDSESFKEPDEDKEKDEEEREESKAEAEMASKTMTASEQVSKKTVTFGQNIKPSEAKSFFGSNELPKKSSIKVQNEQIVKHLGMMAPTTATAKDEPAAKSDAILKKAKAKKMLKEAKGQMQERESRESRMLRRTSLAPKLAPKVIKKPERVSRNSKFEPLAAKIVPSKLPVAKRIARRSKIESDQSVAQVKSNFAALIQAPVKTSNCVPVMIPVTALKLFQSDYQRLNGDYLKPLQLKQNSEREFRAGSNSELKTAYETLAAEVNSLGLDIQSGDKQVKAQIEHAKQKQGIPAKYLDKELIDAFPLLAECTQSKKASAADNSTPIAGTKDTTEAKDVTEAENSNMGDSAEVTAQQSKLEVLTVQQPWPAKQASQKEEQLSSLCQLGGMGAANKNLEMQSDCELRDLPQLTPSDKCCFSDRIKMAINDQDDCDDDVSKDWAEAGSTH